MPARRHGRAEADAGAPLLIRRADRAHSGGLLLVIATLWLAAAISGFVGGHPAIIPGLGGSGVYVAGALGAAFAVIALGWMIRGGTVAIDHGMVVVTERSLSGGRRWHEPLANYREIRAAREQRPHRYGVRSWYVIRLWHPEPGKVIELARARDPALIDRCARDYAVRCGLPLSWHGHQPIARPGAGQGAEIAAGGAAGEPLSAG